MSVHIYRAASQPATRWKDRVLDRVFVHRNPPNRLLGAYCCRRMRPARNLTVQAYYDGVYVFCAEGKGCTVRRRRMRPCPAHGACRGCAAWKASRKAR